MVVTSLLLRFSLLCVFASSHRLATVQSVSILQKLAFGVGQLGFEIDLRRAPTIHSLLLYLKLDFRNIYISREDVCT